MTIAPQTARPLGTMVVYGFTEGDILHDLDLAARLQATCVEILPQWKSCPDPVVLRHLVADRGMTIHSAHGCWGGQSIAAKRVDLASLDPSVRGESIDDIRRCIDWISEAGGRHLVVHPGGLSLAAERDEREHILIDSLRQLADQAGAARVTLCVENMPPGVHPGSHMADLARIVGEVDRVEVGLAVDTGHAHLVGSVGKETRAAGSLLRTTHVHDNHGKSDVHLVPGEGTVDWAEWVKSLDDIGYVGPIMLECIRSIRNNPQLLTPACLALLRSIAGTA